ncbi:MAG TPA: glycosyltransferase family 1 protein, partial [Acidimicrobiales bacterium]|nr:glycosyltransferase family 1 protein [Acidimicrobiales bacterium]
MTPPGVRVALDVHALQVEGWADRGVGRYVVGYASALARCHALAGALLAPELPPPSGLPNELVAADLVRWDTAGSCRSLVQAPGGALAYHVTAPFLHCEPGAPAALEVVEHWARSGVPRVVLLHDLIPLQAPRHYLPSPGHEERYRARAEWVAGADLIVTNSEHTRKEALSLLGCAPSRVVTIGVGVSPFFAPMDGTDEELWRFHFRQLSGRPHLVTVGGSDVRKGTERAITALGLLVARGFDLSLLVLGHLTPAWEEDLRAAAYSRGVGDRVHFGGAVDDELLRACYRRAVATLMPSLAEGAGLPVLESAACGTPALASATTALAETAASPAALFDPTDPGSIADVVAAVVDSAGRRDAIRAVQRD